MKQASPTHFYCLFSLLVYFAVRTSSMSTFDSLELGRYSDDGKDTDERVAGMNVE